MGSPFAWVLVAIVYGLLCGGVYTWLSPRRTGTWRLYFRSAIVFFLIGLALVAILLSLIKA